MSDIPAKAPEKTPTKTASQHLLERAAPARAEWEDLVIVPIFAVIVALALGALVMLATDVDLATIGRSYIALLVGSVGSLNAISETLTAAAPSSWRRLASVSAFAPACLTLALKANCSWAA